MESPEYIDGNSDQEIIFQLANGNASEFSELINRYQKPLLGYITRIVCDEHLAQDITQEVWLRVYSNADKFDRSRAFKPWLYRIAQNLIIDFFRRQKPEVRESDVMNTDETRGLDYFSSSHTKTSVNVSLGREVEQAVTTTIAELPNELYRLILLEVPINGNSMQSVADTTGKNVGTIKYHYNKARNSFRLAFQDRFPEYVDEFISVDSLQSEPRSNDPTHAA